MSELYKIWSVSGIGMPDHKTCSQYEIKNIYFALARILCLKPEATRQLLWFSESNWEKKQENGPG